MRTSFGNFCLVSGTFAGFRNFRVLVSRTFSGNFCMVSRTSFRNCPVSGTRAWFQELGPSQRSCVKVPAPLEYLCGGMFETPVVLRGFRVSYDGRFERLPAWTRRFEAAHALRGWLVTIIRMRGLIVGLTRALQGLNGNLALTFTATWRRGS